MYTYLLCDTNNNKVFAIKAIKQISVVIEPHGYNEKHFNAHDARAQQGICCYLDPRSIKCGGYDLTKKFVKKQKNTDAVCVLCIRNYTV